MRIATFNLENLDDDAGQEPSLQARVAIMRPQLERLAADVLCLQEVQGQDGPQRDAPWPPWTRCLTAPGTRITSGSRQDQRRPALPERNQVILSRFPLVDRPRTIIRDSSSPPPRLPGRHR
jgi:exonuclease III